MGRVSDWHVKGYNGGGDENGGKRVTQCKNNVKLSGVFDQNVHGFEPYLNA